MLTSSELLMRGLSDRTRGLARRTLLRPGDAFRSLLLMAVVVSFSGFMPWPAAAQAPPPAQRTQDDHPYCISHLWAAGSRLGWAEALARQDSQSEDGKMLEYMHAAGHHVQRANELCAASPPPWPAWPNWREVQSQLTEMANKFRDGQLNRAQLAIKIAETYQSLAIDLDLREPTAPLERDATCTELYLRLAVALGYAQKTTQIVQHLTSDAVVRLRQSVSLIYQMRDMPQTCLDYNGLIPAINEALKNPNGSSIVGRVDDIWHAGEVASGPKVE